MDLNKAIELNPKLYLAYLSRGGVIAFADSHVEHHKWLDTRTIVAKSNDYHRHAEPSPGNADIVWLRARTSVRK